MNVPEPRRNLAYRFNCILAVRGDDRLRDPQCCDRPNAACFVFSLHTCLGRADGLVVWSMGMACHLRFRIYEAYLDPPPMQALWKGVFCNMAIESARADKALWDSLDACPFTEREERDRERQRERARGGLACGEREREEYSVVACRSTSVKASE